MDTPISKDILIVDDDPMSLGMLNNYLVHLGFHVSMAKDGLEAVEKLIDNNFPIIISDMHMPQMNGLQLLEHTQAHHKDTEVIIVTSDDEKTTFVDLIKAGAIDYIKKPYSIAELEAKLQRILREKELRHELIKKENLYRTLIESSPT